MFVVPIWISEVKHGRDGEENVCISSQFVQHDSGEAGRREDVQRENLKSSNWAGAIGAGEWGKARKQGRRRKVDLGVGVDGYCA